MTSAADRIDIRLDVLERIYAVYERFWQSLEPACRKHCADCCTCNVTLTTLEGYRLAASLSASRRAAMHRLLKTAQPRERFRPRLTVNAIAERCARGRELPEEIADPSWGRCPLLGGDLCSVYGVRPFGCRCFVSQHPCRLTGSAQVDERVLATNHLFLQIIEHLDAGGCSGNLTDVLLVLTAETGLQKCRRGNLRCVRHGLVPNRPMTHLMVPPEYRRDLEPILAELRACFQP